jgi:hypothetical protein
MPLPRVVPTIRSLPAQLPVKIPVVSSQSTPPVFVGELAVKDIKPGSTLAITTVNHVYTIHVNAPGKGMLTSNNPEVSNGLVILHGAWDIDAAEPRWGALQRGWGLLFAHLPNIGSATKTSAVMKISLTRKGL